MGTDTSLQIAKLLAIIEPEDTAETSFAAPERDLNTELNQLAWEFRNANITQEKMNLTIWHDFIESLSGNFNRINEFELSAPVKPGFSDRNERLKILVDAGQISKKAAVASFEFWRPSSIDTRSMLWLAEQLNSPDSDLVQTALSVIAKMGGSNSRHYLFDRMLPNETRQALLTHVPVALRKILATSNNDAHFVPALHILTHLDRKELLSQDMYNLLDRILSDNCSDIKARVILAAIRKNSYNFSEILPWRLVVKIATTPGLEFTISSDAIRLLNRFLPLPDDIVNILDGEMIKNYSYYKNLHLEKLNKLTKFTQPQNCDQLISKSRNF